MRMKTGAKRKNRYETSVPVNITLPPLLHEKLSELVKAKGFSGPSDYVQARIRLDAGLTLQDDEARQAA